MRVLLAILGFCFFLSGYAQQHSKKALLEDLHFLNEAFKNGHGANYRQKGEHKLDSFIDSLSAHIPDSINSQSYYFLLSSVISEIGCLHTSIIKSDLLEGDQKITYFPLHVQFLQKRIFVVNQADSAFKHLEGKEIKSINGLSSGELFRKLSHFRADDGNSGAFGKAYLNRYAYWLISFYQAYPDSFAVAFADHKINMAANSKAPARKKKDIPSVTFLHKNLGNHIHFVDTNTAYLRLLNFNDSDIPFYKNCFRSINQRKAKNLIIDLRGNKGGSRDAGVKLMQYLAKTSFSYSVLQPKLNPWPYFNFKSKCFYALAHLKYNVGDLFKTKRIDGQGWTFEYKYQPTFDTIGFKGKVVVLTDGFTGSTSTMFCSWLHQQKRAVFIGQPWGGGYNGNNGGSFPMITLPHSETVVRFPIFRLVFDANSKIEQGLKPHYRIDYTIEDVLKEEDLELKKAMALIRKTEAAPQ